MPLSDPRVHQFEDGLTLEQPTIATTQREITSIMREFRLVEAYLPPTISADESLDLRTHWQPPGQQQFAFHVAQLEHRGAFIGRSDEIAHIKELLAHPGVITLVGPGGVGKTRLALRVAVTVREHYPAGIVYVSLEALTDAQTVAPEIASAFGIGGQAHVVQSIAQTIGQRRLLLILDNFENIIDAADVVATLAASCANLTVLLTSREPVDILAEQIVEVPPLSLPTHLTNLSREAIYQASAIQLFLERAARVIPGLSVDDQQVLAIADICTRVAGIPLAIELAAAQLQLYRSPRVLRDQMNRGVFALLESDKRDQSRRHRTLWNTIDWSYRLLPARSGERALFRRMAVFAGGCTLDAAAAICGAMRGTDRGIERQITSLSDKHLLYTYESPLGDLRISMLQPIRDFAVVKLSQSRHEHERLCQAHATYYSQFVATLHPAFTSEQQAAALARAELEHDNIRAAMRQHLESGALDEGLKLAANLWLFWQRRSHLAEARRWLEEILQRIDVVQADTALAARPLVALGQVLYDFGEYASALECCGRCRMLAESSGDRWCAAQAELIMGHISRGQEHYRQAQQHYRRCLAEFIELNEQRSTGDAHMGLGLTALGQHGDRTVVAENFELALELYRDVGDLWGEAHALQLISNVTRDVDLDEAREYGERGLAIQLALGHRRGVAYAQLGLARVQFMSAKTREPGFDLIPTLRTFYEIGDRPGVVATLDLLAEIAAHEHRHYHAGLLLGGAHRLRASILRQTGSARRKRSPAGEGDPRFSKGYAEGSSTPTERLIAQLLAATSTQS